MYIRASLALTGEELELRRDACITINGDGVIESIEGWGSCPPSSLGGAWAVVLPQPANAHVHSADGAFPEFGTELGLHELVAPPSGLKYRLLSALDVARLVTSIAKTYMAAYAKGVGLVVDFREGGGAGCVAAQLARRSLPEGLDVLVLGTPGPSFPQGCTGLGLSSPLDYTEGFTAWLASNFRPSLTHVAEDPRNRADGDLEVALRAGFTAIVHGTYLSRADLEAVAERGVGLVLCPRSNMWHSLRLPPVLDAIEAGVTIGLGTDNAAWSDPDPWKEANLALLIARQQGGRGVERAILRALLVGGYEALRQRGRAVVEGGKAHFVLVDGESSGILRSIDAVSAIIKRSGDWLVARVDGDGLTYLSSSPGRRR